MPSNSHEIGPLAMISAFMASAEGSAMSQPCAQGRKEKEAARACSTLTMQLTLGPIAEPHRDFLLRHALSELLHACWALHSQECPTCARDTAMLTDHLHRAKDRMSGALRAL